MNDAYRSWWARLPRRRSRLPRRKSRLLRESSCLTHRGQCLTHRGSPLRRLRERCEKGNPAGSVRLAPAVIQKIVRTNFGAFRKCYEDGLRRDPKLAGHVRIGFIIALDGTVSAARD